MNNDQRTYLSRKRNKEEEIHNGIKIVKEEPVKIEDNKREFNNLNERNNKSSRGLFIDTNKNLPITAYKEKIMDAIRNNQVTVIAGETGCGKTTQVPQFLYKECLEKNDESFNMIITQPRRIAAVSIAKRLSQEMNVRCGEEVGYHVGMSPVFTTGLTKILIMTTGIFLQRIIHEKNLDEFTHIILDEVHERDIDIDFVLIMVKHIIKRNSHIKLILMSATICTALFANYFSPVNIASIDDVDFYKDTLSIKQSMKEEATLDPEENRKLWNDNNCSTVYKEETCMLGLQEESFEVQAVNNEVDLEVGAAPIIKIDDKIYPVQMFYLESIKQHLKRDMNITPNTNIYFDKKIPKIDEAVYELCMHLITAIHNKKVLLNEPSKYTILVFLPGLGEIMSMNDVIKTKMDTSISEQMEILHLHSNLNE